MNDYDAMFEVFNNEIKNEEIIPHHNKCEHDFVNDDGHYFCRKCNLSRPLFVEEYIPYHERRIFVSAPYLKQNHFKVKLNEIQGINAIYITEDIMSLCQGINNQEDIKKILQQHKKIKYYGLVYTILRQMNIYIPTYTREELNKLSYYFEKLIPIYENIKDPIQKNLINYHFIIGRLSIKIGREDMLPYLFSLRSKKKRLQYGRLWDEINKLI